MLVAGCAQNIDFADPATMTDAPEVVSGTQTRSLDGAVYNEVVDAWMVPQPDPYTLANFQAAYDKLAAGKSTQTLSKAQAAEFTPAKKLAPTHYALKIYPKTEEEQWQVEMMEDVQVAYIPFDWVRLRPAEVEKLPLSKTRSAANTFPEKSPYTVTYQNDFATDGGPTGPRTYQLPILYTVWPVAKPLPDDLEYVVDYEVYLPRAAVQTRSSDALTILETEAVSPKRAPGLFAIPTTYEFTKYVKTYDNTLGQAVPMANLKIQMQKGSNISYFTTNSAGMFKITRQVPFVIDEYFLTAMYQDMGGRWTISSSGSLIPLSTWIDAPYSDMEVQTLISSARQENEIHRAVNYFFNNQSVFTKPNQQGGINIVAKSTSDGIIGGGLIYSPWDDPYIVINNSGKTQSEIIGATLHELGHYAHYWATTSFHDTQAFLQESFASYSGWYLGEQYYLSQGWVFPGGDPQIVGSSWQEWFKTDDLTFVSNNLVGYYGWYSPLFIDLTDNYNQGATNPNYYPNDQIQGISPGAIWAIASTSRTWLGSGQCREKIVNLVGAYPAFGEWIDDFDAWASTYPLVYTPLYGPHDH